MNEEKQKLLIIQNEQAKMAKEIQKMKANPVKRDEYQI